MSWDRSAAEPPSATVALLALSPAADRSFTAARVLGGASSVLAIGTLGSSLELITGSSPRGVGCCTTATATPLDPAGRTGRSHTLTKRLDGSSVAQFIDLGHNRGIALMASGAGVWASSPGGPAVTLDGPTASPRSLAATAVGTGGWAAAWSDTGGAGGAARIVLAGGAATAATTRRGVFLSLPAGDAVDGVAIGDRGHRPTVGWTESWFDRQGIWHSRAYAAEPGSRRPPTPLSSPDQQAEDLEFGDGPGGLRVAAWKSCDPASGICAVHAALRSAGSRGGWQTGQRLGRIDPGEAPAVAVTAGGTALVTWLDGGRVFCATANADARRLGRGALVAAAGRSAHALTVAAGPKAGAIAAWQQGSAAIAIEAARFVGR